jgi:hypothetical protein
VALITQSVDSRNHVIVAASVTVGLVASLLRFPLLDTLVGLAVALLILKSAAELAIEVVRSMAEDEADLSRYQLGVVERYEQFRRAQLRDWLLYLVGKQGVQTHADLAARARQSLDFTGNPTLRELGLAEHPPPSETIEHSIQALFDLGWVEGDDRLSITGSGKEHLQRLWATRGERHWSVPHGPDQRVHRRRKALHMYR